MHLILLQKKYKKLVHDLHDLESTIIYLRGELKWSPSVSDSLFKAYDGALDERDHLEEELYQLDLMIKKDTRIDYSYSEIDNVIPFPSRVLN